MLLLLQQTGSGEEAETEQINASYFTNGIAQAIETDACNDTNFFTIAAIREVKPSFDLLLFIQGEPMTHAEEIEERRRRRLQRWYNALPPEKKVMNIQAFHSMVDQGLATPEGELTDAGQLRMHQLETLKWMTTSRRYKK